ncbi:acyl-CoA dehydrogenase family protein [Brevundimonas sp.]|jgi:alkylation response protein AidB-like acyl-CoA dehydrogenase|uniref:acyl-CoA dehydrogenase family protein n=1 Tax=Brevundimonas sp. TaxID=1871086 RepID=UPI0037848382
MDFSLNEEQAALKESVRRLCDRDYGFEHRRGLLRSSEGFSRELWATFAELGWLGAGLSDDEFGYGGGPIETMILQEAFGRALVVEPYLSCAVIAARAVAALGDAAQKAELLSAIVGGEALVSLAHNEVGMRGNDGAITTVAVSNGNGWRISGRKGFVLGGPSADFLLVSASTPTGVTLFKIAAGAPGVEVLAYHAVDGRRVADFVLNDVEVADDAVIGPVGGALPGIELAVDHGVIGLLAECVGAMDAALWLTRDYLKTRKQFGVTLNTFQALQHRMADMLVETELARSMLLRGVAALSETDPAKRRAGVSAAKVQVTEAAVKVTAEAIQLHGGIGVTEEYIVGHFYKRAVLARGLFGGTDSHVERFAGHPRQAAA